MNSVPRKVPFVSQKNGRNSQNYGCGVACLLMLLKFHCEVSGKYKYRDLEKQLAIDRLPSAKGYHWYPDDLGQGAYIEDIARWLTGNRFVFMTAYDVEPEKSLHCLQDFLRVSPAMVGMSGKQHGKGGHWMVIERAARIQMWLLDPLKGQRSKAETRQTVKEFKSQWDGYAVGIVGRY